MLTVKDLRCGYDGGDILKGISFELSAGEILCVSGPNGCGKTTILRALDGLLPYRGSIKFAGGEISSMKRRDISSRVALMTQINSIYFSYTVFETVMQGRYLQFSGKAFSSPGAADKDYVMSCLEDVGLADLRDRQITELSGGQLQRVFLARAFAQEPQLIMLDEPTNHLDLKYQLELTDQLSEWARHKNHAVIAVLHDLNLTLSFATRVLLLKDGETAAFGDVSSMLEGGLLQKVYSIDVKKHMVSSLEKWLA
jgi:iron complex transport system ATP-binding protein